MNYKNSIKGIWMEDRDLFPIICGLNDSKKINDTNNTNSER